MLHVHVKALIVALFLSATFHTAADIRGVTGYGAFPVSSNTLAVWLNGEDGAPLIMVYYHGPPQWHDTHWTFDSQFTQTAVGWQEFKSDKATLRFLVDLGAGRAEIQHNSFSLAQNNTFLVVHTTDAQQKVIPLGHHKLLKTGQSPAAVMLLDADKTLKSRIQHEAGSI
jgi:hypothetical protein